MSEDIIARGSAWSCGNIQEFTILVQVHRIASKYCWYCSSFNTIRNPRCWLGSVKKYCCRGSSEHADERWTSTGLKPLAGTLQPGEPFDAASRPPAQQSQTCQLAVPFAKRRDTGPRFFKKKKKMVLQQRFGKRFQIPNFLNEQPRKEVADPRSDVIELVLDAPRRAFEVRIILRSRRGEDITSY